MQNNSFIIAAIIFLFLSNKLTIFLLNKSIISSFSLTKNTRIRLRVRLNDKIENGSKKHQNICCKLLKIKNVMRKLKISQSCTFTEDSASFQFCFYSMFVLIQMNYLEKIQQHALSSSGDLIREKFRLGIKCHLGFSSCFHHCLGP